MSIMRRAINAHPDSTQGVFDRAQYTMIGLQREIGDDALRLG